MDKSCVYNQQRRKTHGVASPRSEQEHTWGSNPRGISPQNKKILLSIFVRIAMPEPMQRRFGDPTNHTTFNAFGVQFEVSSRYEFVRQLGQVQMPISSMPLKYHVLLQCSSSSPRTCCSCAAHVAISHSLPVPPVPNRPPPPLSRELTASPRSHLRQTSPFFAAPMIFTIGRVHMA